MRGFLLFFLYLFCCSATNAQLTANQLLASAWDDPSVQLLREQQAYLDGHDFNLPLLSQIQLRTGTRDWDPTQQEYAIRLQGNTPGMKRTQASIHATLKSLTEAERLVLVQRALVARYELLIDAYFAKQSRSLLLRQQAVLADKKAVFAEQLSLGVEQDLDDYFRAEEDLLTVERRLHSLGTEQPVQQVLAKIFTGKADSVSVDTLIEPLVLLMALSANMERIPPSVKREQIQAELAALEVEMQRMKGRNLLDYLQFGYTGNANDPFNNRFRLGAGVTLPWPNGSKLQIQERELQALEAKAAATSEQRAAEEAMLRKGAEFGKLFEQLLFLKKQAETFAQQYDPQRLHASGLENPETLLRVQEGLLRLELDALAMEKDSYQAYLALLAETGLLVQEPARNWLSPNMELIAR
jgi:hypothetical protein